MGAPQALRQAFEWADENRFVTLVCDFSRGDGSRHDYYYATSSPFAEMAATLFPERRPAQDAPATRDPLGFSSLPPGRGLFHRWHQVCGTRRAPPSAPQ